ncbi:hypothetical protein E4898_02155 [Salmonella enterica subsp. enterica serovar Anatum]|uniref:Uncharacterized protein n=2 Tax=Salmonella enterica TaxID=28901 RepID=A0A5Z9NFN6_SALAN|nr:hypothetical protein [Salmonella enterica]EAM4267050.1 hypothetical protein [Salmonella enterica subsp. enterica serovar Muenchen]EAV8216700.1 hypothetical protein [Salmonella enterica subsp. enterica]EBV5994641.1 hypothetical protein [Salmonella enterica subsp. enterica serovar Ohio]EBV9488683.1 hypothetical protein [Salmonella enterica subsp. enterica serovar Muenster]ECO0921609.1 hypothetical protein [Salmonella enterica subsp. enterica serovar Infantis]ECS3707861.1 hypothetical protein
MTTINEVFGRINSEGNVDILFADSGESVTRLDANVFPVGSDFGARYDHPEGITLTRADAESLGIDIE